MFADSQQVSAATQEQLNSIEEIYYFVEKLFSSSKD